MGPCRQGDSSKKLQRPTPTSARKSPVDRLLTCVAETDAFHRAGIVAIDTTEDDPFTGDRTGYEAEIIGTKDDKYAYQWATIQLVGNTVPIVLDARPVQKGDTRVEILQDLLGSAQEHATVDNVLMDRKFDSQHILEEIDQRGHRYVVPKRMQTSEQPQAKRLLQWDQDRYVTGWNLLLNNEMPAQIRPDNGIIAVRHLEIAPLKSSSPA